MLRIPPCVQIKNESVVSQWFEVYLHSTAVRSDDAPPIPFGFIVSDADGTAHTVTGSSADPSEHVRITVEPGRSSVVFLVFEPAVAEANVPIHEIVMVRHRFGHVPIRMQALAAAPSLLLEEAAATDEGVTVLNLEPCVSVGAQKVFDVTVTNNGRLPTVQ